METKIKLGRKEQKALIEQGKYQCTGCDTIKPIDDFGKDGSSVKGFSSRCKSCKKTEVEQRTKRRIKNRVVITEKTCRDCSKTQPVSNFNKDDRTIDGYAPMCKLCWDEYWLNWYQNERSDDTIKKMTETSKRNWKKYSEQGHFPNGKTISQSSKERTERYKPKRNKRKKERYDNEPEFKFQTLVMSHLRGVENRKEFIDKWDSKRKYYDSKGIIYHIDHMVPKSWFIINTDMELINHMDNLQVIDADYNLSKQDRWSDPVPSHYLDKIRPYIKKEFQGLLKSL